MGGGPWAQAGAVALWNDVSPKAHGRHCHCHSKWARADVVRCCVCVVVVVVVVVCVCVCVGGGGVNEKRNSHCAQRVGSLGKHTSNMYRLCEATQAQAMIARRALRCAALLCCALLHVVGPCRSCCVPPSLPPTCPSWENCSRGSVFSPLWQLCAHQMVGNEGCELRWLHPSQWWRQCVAVTHVPTLAVTSRFATACKQQGSQQ
jgi:hypothetical protein